MSDLMIKVVALDIEIDRIADLINNFRFCIEDLETLCIEMTSKIKERDYIISIIRGMVEA